MSEHIHNHDEEKEYTHGQGEHCGCTHDHSYHENEGHCMSHSHHDEHLERNHHEHQHKEHCHCEEEHTHPDSCCSCGCEHGHSDEEEGNSKKLIISALFFAGGMILEHAKLPAISYGNLDIAKTAAVLMFLISFINCGKNVVINAIRNILKGKLFDEQFLMSTASIGAILVGQIPEAVAVMLFYQIGEFFEDYAVDKSRDSINALMEICPDKATVIHNGIEKTVDADDLKCGETIIVKPGERIPADGTVIKGKSFIDNSALTGESVPRAVFEGNEVFSGAINTHAAIVIKVTKPAQDSAAARILKLAEQSSERKTKTERFITRFSKIYTPLVCSLALIVAVLPPFFIGLTKGNWQWSEWIYRALMFLVISCPCALVISVPLSFFGGIGKASRNGILVKGSCAIEHLASIRTAVFDKTGTLTKGVFMVTEVHSEDPESLSEEDLITLAAHAETYSNHPAAVSLKKAHHCTEKCTMSNVTDAEEITGQGIRVNLNGKTILAGNARLMTENGVSGFKEKEQPGYGTTVYLSIDGKYCGYIVISDETKADAKNSITLLRKLGIKKIVMLTGDTESSGKKIAEETGLDEVYANLMPEDKVSRIEALIEELKVNGKKRGTLAFAGDGINDAPVISRADVGIAMGALGSDAAIESADVVIMTDEPGKIAEAIKISRKTLSIVYQNIILSLGVKAAIMILSASGLGNMWLAVFGDVGVCFIAILNAMRALGKPQKVNI